MARLLAALGIFLTGLLVGAYCQPVTSSLQNVFAPPETRPTATVFVLPPATRPVPPTPTSPLPPTLTRPPVPTSTPGARSWTIPLRGGGEMTVNADTLEAAINNVKSQGGDPEP